MHPTTLSLAACTLLIPLSAFAEEHAAHEHGHGELNLAIDGQQLLIELHAPAADVIGFEHPPRNAKEQQQQAQALESLQHADRLFVLPAAAGCQLQQQQVEASHEAEPEPASAAAQTRQPAAEHDAAHQHSDIQAEYAFHCQHPTELNRLTLTLFAHYPTLEKVSLQAIVPGTPDRSELSASQPTLQW